MEQKPKILVVDDNEANLTLLRTILRRLDYPHLVARTGEEALKLVAHDQPDLVILDVMMPGMDGIEVCRRLKDDDDTRFVPVIIMTALNDPEDRIRGIEAGADDFLTKPVNERELVARLQTALAMKRAIDHKVGALTNINDYLSRFVPREVRRVIEQHPEAPALTQRERDVSVLFLDVSGYSRLTRDVGYDTLNRLVERYFSHYVDCIDEHDGDINETAGDGMMVVFQGEDHHEHARRAARTTLRVLEVTDLLNRARRDASGPITIHMGLNCGRALVGSTRYDGLRGTRWVFTARGPVTNLAARLAGEATAGQILVGPDMAQRLADDFVLEPLGPREFKNVGAVEVHRLIGPMTGPR